MSFAMPELSSEVHIAFFMSGLAEIPGILFAWVAMERYGRKSTMLGSLLLGGVFSTAIAVVPDGNSTLSTNVKSGDGPSQMEE